MNKFSWLAVAVLVGTAFLMSCASVEEPEGSAMAMEPEPAAVKPALVEPAPAVDASVDHVGFPADYRDSYMVFYEFDRPDNRSARVIWANTPAGSVQAADFNRPAVEPNGPFPYGSVLVMEVYRTEREDSGEVVLDPQGRYVRGELFGLFVMRKERGFGVKYGGHRNGEWEYAAYRPDGTTLTAPERTMACATCHLEAGAAKDWVFGVERHLTGASGIARAENLGPNTINLADYLIEPKSLVIPVGTEVTFVNNDLFMHVMLDIVGGEFNSRALRPKASFKHTFEKPGTYEYFCSIHPTMTGTIEVTP